MSRLLFAAARGARIQTRYQYPKKRWGVVAGIRTDDFYEYRIHPDDEHLQYGPISTALRDAAVGALDDHPCVFYASLGNFWLMTADFKLYQDCDNELHRSLFLLIMAESLADIGM